MRCWPIRAPISWATRQVGGVLVGGHFVGIAGGGFVGGAEAAQVRGDQAESVRQARHDLGPGEPEVRPAMQEQERRAGAAFGDVDGDAVGLDEAGLDVHQCSLVF
jgi:hypothetical protein